MDAKRGLELQRRAIEAFLRGMTAGSPGAELLELDGVMAAIVPGCPDRAVPNSAIHAGAKSLRGSLDELADAYERAGVRAHAMWTLEPDPEVEAALENAGYGFDGEPAAMCAELDAMPLAEVGDLDWDAEATTEEVGRVNDLAYGYPQGKGMAAAIGPSSDEAGIRSYRARVAGEVACVLQTFDVGSDVLVSWVATLPEFRDRKLASRLLAAALGAARDRGHETTTLQASMLGRGVYERLGYELIQPLRLHERRVVSAQ